jgi:AcrR family transcriptional regulator
MGNKAKTKEEILSALSKLLGQKGFEHLGVNSIAREAGVDKVLIYRYFGGLKQLFRFYASQGEFWPRIEKLLMDSKRENKLEDMPVKDLSAELLKRHLKELLNRPITQNIMCWELLTQNELTKELADFRERQSRKLLSLPQFQFSKNSKMDIPAVGALLMAGISYLILRSHTAAVYMGVKLKNRNSWKRMERAVQTLVHAYFQYYESGDHSKKK